MTSEFIWTLLTIIGIDIILGGDNAIVVAMACRHLPPHIRHKAIVMGIMLAVAARGILTVAAVYLLEVPFLMAIGGLFLVWIAIRLVLSDDSHGTPGHHYSIADAVKTIVIADVVMGFDNVIAVAGAAGGNTSLVIAGLLISVPVIIWGSKIILFVMKKYPVIVYIGAGILLYTAGKMILHEEAVLIFIEKSPVPVSLFIPGLVTIGLSGAWLKSRLNGIAFFIFPFGKK